MGKVYEDDYRIPGFAGDRYGRAGLANMMNVMLEISERQLETLHAGMDAINEFQAGWVITQYHMDIQRMPRIEEPLRVGTEATTYNKFFTYRDYWIDDAQGQRLVTVNSNWVIMDLRTRKIVDVIPELVERVGAVSDRKIKRFPRLKKITTPDGQEDFHVRYFDIDSNGHVNNAHYLEWMENSLGYDFLSTHTLRGAYIRYEREVAYGTTPVAQYQHDPDDPTKTLHRVVTGEQVNAEAQMIWQDFKA